MTCAPLILYEQQLLQHIAPCVIRQLCFRPYAYSIDILRASGVFWLILCHSNCSSSAGQELFVPQLL